jgi:hypothetical protein
MRRALPRERLVDDKLFLYQQKTGMPVYCPLPPSVVENLIAVQNDNDRFFFCDGTSPAAAHGQKLGSCVPEGVHDGEADNQRRPPLIEVTGHSLLIVRPSK